MFTGIRLIIYIVRNFKKIFRLLHLTCLCSRVYYTLPNFSTFFFLGGGGARPLDPPTLNMPMLTPKNVLYYNDLRF